MPEKQPVEKFNVYENLLQYPLSDDFNKPSPSSYLTTEKECVYGIDFGKL